MRGERQISVFFYRQDHSPQREQVLPSLALMSPSSSISQHQNFDSYGPDACSNSTQGTGEAHRWGQPQEHCNNRRKSSHCVFLMLLPSPTDNWTSMSFQMTEQSTAISSLFSPILLQEPSLQSAAPPSFPQHPTRSPRTTDSSTSCSPSSHSMHVRM